MRGGERRRPVCRVVVHDQDFIAVRRIILGQQ
jgi:hypothetical protein